MNIDADGMKNINWVPNSSVTVVESDGDKFSIVTPTYNEHLAGIETTLPSNV